MKTPILVALSAVAALAGAANAQTADSKEGIQLKDIPGIGPFFRTNPDLSRNQTAGTRLRVERTPRGEILQIEIVEQNSGEALRQIAAVLGVNIVIDPAIQFLPAKTRTFYLNDTTGDLFDYLSGFIVRDEAVEKWKSSAGTYFFAAKNTSFNGPMIFRKMPDGTWKRADGLSQPGDLFVNPREKTREAPRFDPFVYPDGGIHSKDYFSRPIEPLPHWEKRQFNGHEFYYIPGPKLPG